MPEECSCGIDRLLRTNGHGRFVWVGCEMCGREIRTIDGKVQEI